ncbi:acetyl-CoA hydrolase/transferase-like protein [Mesorhizobium sp. J18]|uniref:acetyl-CoA hydrolase/transferase family protein n=1 Tax=Mesorhizobium sp. J18 TaxID=935263 RepID=UPI00119C6FF7|nr:acetyl-CoA hydrolase/transferase C-terminal domain-containing protein [Mesorhizobium sp. J18]TWG92069.1 acetyl-CoA hydrolase/transferase-like protein [Mesorhizobium sp. J18]
MNGAARAILASLRPGDRIFLPGSAGEVASLSAALVAGEGPPLAITATYVPGINASLAGRLPAHSSFANLFASGNRGSQADDAMRHLPYSYGGFCAYLAATEFEATIAHVAPPDGSGKASLGPAVEFTPIALRRSRRLIAVVNPNLPDIPGAERIDISDADLVVESDEPLGEYDVGAPSPRSDCIARNVADFVDDGAALQIGLGKVPDALLRKLTDRRGIRLWSGMLSDGARGLAEAGTLDPDFRHVSCVHVGTRSYYDWLAGREGLAVRACNHTHAATALSAVPGLIAINSALAVDLFGQANLETLDGRAISGVGGAADFARSASLAPDGISIIALPATSPDRAASRIVPRLDGPVSLPRHDVEIVVTEFGVADLRGATTVERAERLIGIAAPHHRQELETAWREIMQAL